MPQTKLLPAFTFALLHHYNLEGQGSHFDHTQFSPGGDLLLSINSEGLLRYWRAPSISDIDATEGARSAPEM